ncbi:MAG: hypothetical protein FWF24_02125 [Alphaproteobacteria bacterium]|nr:hypothetical protein [Alphaproteobacteria bacterium]
MIFDWKKAAVCICRVSNARTLFTAAALTLCTMLPQPAQALVSDADHKKIERSLQKEIGWMGDILKDPRAQKTIRDLTTAIELLHPGNDENTMRLRKRDYDMLLPQLWTESKLGTDKKQGTVSQATKVTINHYFENYVDDLEKHLAKGNSNLIDARTLAEMKAISKQLKKERAVADKAGRPLNTEKAPYKRMYEIVKKHEFLDSFFALLYIKDTCADMSSDRMCPGKARYIFRYGPNAAKKGSKRDFATLAVRSKMLKQGLIAQDPGLENPWEKATTKTLSKPDMLKVAKRHVRALAIAIAHDFQPR